ncbi:MAG: hypothetical protein EOP04_24335 [Proteobacteria bacterium]|nr:MAG: hypothetical protein EOP04_24335 [Pseudomonadota bacterium]
MGIQWIGWLSSMVLIATVAWQVRKQIRDQTSQGVSRWLYLGQTAAEIGFILYSYLLRNWVFVFTNTVLLLFNVVGYVVTIRHRRLRRTAELKPIQPAFLNG